MARFFISKINFDYFQQLFLILEYLLHHKYQNRFIILWPLVAFFRLNRQYDVQLYNKKRPSRRRRAFLKN